MYTCFYTDSIQLSPCCFSPSCSVWSIEEEALLVHVRSISLSATVLQIRSDGFYTTTSWSDRHQGGVFLYTTGSYQSVLSCVSLKQCMASRCNTWRNKKLIQTVGIHYPFSKSSTKSWRINRLNRLDSS